MRRENPILLSFIKKEVKKLILTASKNEASG